MRLLHSSDLSFHEFFDDPPPYAILSHTWDHGHEVSFTEMSLMIKEGQESHFGESRECDQIRQKSGYKKIRASCRQACSNGLDYIWIDTCCINKDSSAELSEAINSMMHWYAGSAICYIYLGDLDSSSMSIESRGWDSDNVRRLSTCRYWTRGWCLQELLAPATRHFYDRRWVRFGAYTSSDSFASTLTTAAALMKAIAEITNIHEHALTANRGWSSFSVAQKMSWAAKRKTSRIEDQSYCLLGLFDVNMPLLYGEGHKAFIRLQQEIIRSSDDQSLFAWHNDPVYPGSRGRYTGLLAWSPKLFARARNIVPFARPGRQEYSPYYLTNRGIHITLDLRRELSARGRVYALLSCRESAEGPPLSLCLAEPWSHQDDAFGGPETQYLDHYLPQGIELNGIYRDNGTESPTPDGTELSCIYLANPRTMIIGPPRRPASLHRYAFLVRHPPAGLQVRIDSITPGQSLSSLERASSGTSGDPILGTLLAEGSLRAAVRVHAIEPERNFLILVRRHPDCRLLTCYMVACAGENSWGDLDEALLWQSCVSSLSYCPMAIGAPGTQSRQNCLHAELHYSDRDENSLCIVSLYFGDSVFRGSGMDTFHPSQGFSLCYGLGTQPSDNMKHALNVHLAGEHQWLSQEASILGYDGETDGTHDVRSWEEVNNARLQTLAAWKQQLFNSPLNLTKQQRITIEYMSKWHPELKEYWYLLELRVVLGITTFKEHSLKRLGSVQPWICRPPPFL